ncbi:MAG TPA: phosphoribosylaminoimidazolesuccinocarboxamide synthase, partial [Synergistales bacterium]|nr:phosphoribosylaminoimidazolesuccinocarboxamide synthase [Synergistales bacterium]
LKSTRITSSFSKEELEKIREITLRVNQLLKKYFEKLDVILVDFKLEFGKDCEGNLLLSDEISPDTCRFWDRSSGEKLDKDRFRKDLGNVLGAYEEIWSRITSRGE